MCMVMNFQNVLLCGCMVGIAVVLAISIIAFGVSVFQMLSADKKRYREYY